MSLRGVSEMSNEAISRMICIGDCHALRLAQGLHLGLAMTVFKLILFVLVVIMVLYLLISTI